MNYYIDVKVLSDKDTPENHLLNTAYTCLHKSLFDMKSSVIGVSFPNYNIKLGDTIRLHGNLCELKELGNRSWLDNLEKYCCISEIKPIPNNIKYRLVSRVQPTMSMAKLRRLIKRGSISEEDVTNYKAKMFSKGLELPYLELESISNGQKHRRYINHGDLQTEPSFGNFDFFGLSCTATIPWF
ncbi:type I-F CRISPR-associated endoribonuclease Cas6/Csy4 [Seleniivibrio woodruffii]|uniref:type I-F CRISPR-associated endoribonuclease Cas6/Csy4 n=1 Tax=Seleniivibrio woodruffii TaxID=1078050 RepID=UPI0024096873|nr:type I-F CRISPR-associated endoribonuclease Cas6/Csy4 [Seleniivibrio woodruffii]